MNDNIEERLRDLGQAIGRDESMASHVMQRIEETSDDRSFAPGERSHGVRIRRLATGRIGKWAAAAIIAVCLLGVLWAFRRTSNVSWAEIRQRVAEVQAIAYTLHVTATGLEHAPEGQTFEARIETMQLADGCARTDTYIDERWVSRSCVLPDDRISITLWPDLQQYTVLELPAPLCENLRTGASDPRRMLEDVLLSDHTTLGQREINGVTVEGLESHPTTPKVTLLCGPFGPRLSVVPPLPGKTVSRLWVDVATGWPVELTMAITDADGAQNTLLAFTDFRWNVTLERGAVPLTIPAHYRHLATVNLTRMGNGKQIIEGLAYFAGISGGRYPSELTPAAIGTEVNAICRARAGSEGSPPELDDAKINNLKMAAAHIATLAEDGHDPAYSGATVTATDRDKILLRWRGPGSQYHVIFGDLRTAEVTAQELAALETP